ncbi:MAG TPA: metal-dependent hydrolase [Candidatus Limnocylindrales bacterium]|jgi:L-ascorbate metabolism protein UlaG (beta-lactamase superfamily)|nr:metal-dependent hydrolase [Candidatus Limnocylindrales bacterium]
MANLRITRLGHGGVLYRSPNDAWVWVDRWTGAPNYADEYRTPEKVSVVAPTHGHFDHVGDDLADVRELAGVDGAVVVCGHEMQIQLAAMGIESVGMNKGGTFEAAGIGFTMVHAEHTGGATLTDGSAPITRELGCWGWILEFEDGMTVYHSGDTDLFGDMRLIGERFSPEVAVLPIGGHYTMGPRDAGRALDLVGAATVIPVHYATFPALVGTPKELADHSSANVVELEPGETWEARG